MEADAFRVCFAQNRQQTDKQNKLFSKITSALSLARTKTGVPIKVSKATNPLLVYENRQVLLLHRRADRIQQGIVTPFCRVDRIRQT